MEKSKHIVLIGAPIGKVWDIPHLPERITIDEYSLEFVDLYQFDKKHKQKAKDF
jgi:hypothetical protein